MCLYSVLHSHEHIHTHEKHKTLNNNNKNHSRRARSLNSNKNTGETQQKKNVSLKIACCFFCFFAFPIHFSFKSILFFGEKISDLFLKIYI